ncbi:MAG: sigma-70 family RNA polymerase sigma factor [Myxococcales bacterium]|nr:sigma-70 family RNA polymerase sigma factor [Myxococcales bacterium]
MKASSDAPEAKRTFEGLPLVTADGHTRASTGIGPRGGPEDRGSSNDQRSSRERSGADAHGGDPHRALVERVQREVPYATTAFSELVDTLGSSVFARARRILGSSEDAEDALQEVFLRVFRSIAEFRFDRPFVHWLQVITLNTCRQGHGCRGPHNQCASGLGPRTRLEGGLMLEVHGSSVVRLVIGAARASGNPFLRQIGISTK